MVPKGNIIIVDREYRDAVKLLIRLGIRYKMPALIQPGERQFSTKDANDSQIITKSRWIVEARNGHMKTIFKFFSNIVPIPHLLNVGDFFRIAGAIINRYHPTIIGRG